MGVLNYSDLGLTIVKGIKTFKWGTKEIQILTYLPVETKYDIVMITLQKSFEDGIYNPIKLDMFYHLNLVYAFTNLVFTDEERADESKLYDEMLSSGFLETFLQQLDIQVYTEMQTAIDNIAELSMRYKISAASIVAKFIDDLPANAEIMKNIVNEFDPEKYKAVTDFAKAANGGRPIS